MVVLPPLSMTALPIFPMSGMGGYIESTWRGRTVLLLMFPKQSRPVTLNPFCAEAYLPTPGLVSENPFHKFANLDVYPLDPTLLICLLEDHTGSRSPATVVNSLCFINVSTKTVSPLNSDASFYSSPRFSPDGKRLVWIEWDLPDMPWNGTEIWIADVLATPESPSPLILQNLRHVAGEHGKISVAYPHWLSNDTLLFTSDLSGFENPWTYNCASVEAKPVFETPLAESFAYGSPPKKLGWSPYAIVNEQGTAAVFTAIKDGRSVLYLVDLATGTAELLSSSYTEILHIRSLRPVKNQIIFIGKKADTPPALVQCTLPATISSQMEPVFTNLQSGSHGLTLPRQYISLPRPLSLLMPHERGPRPVHVIYYAPNNPEYTGMNGEKPPCVLNVHGGPIGFSAQSFDATKQFFTTRGWAW